MKNIYADQELGPEATTEESSVVQKEGSREVQRPQQRKEREAREADQDDEANLEALE